MTSEQPQVVGARPFGAQLEAMRGEPQVAAGLPLTPIARRLAVWWPGGGWVYAWPAAVEYREGIQMRRVRILPIQTLGLAALTALGLAAFAAFITQRWMAARPARQDEPN